GVRPVDLDRVEAGLALDGVVVVAGVPDEGVVAGAHEGDVVAVPAVDEVTPLAADHLVVAEAAIDSQVDRARGQAGGVDGVDPRLAVHGESVLGRDAADNVDHGRQPVDTEAGRAAADDD